MVINSSNKLRALTGGESFMYHGLKRILFNSYFPSHLNYIPLIWMNHSRSLNNKISKLHEITSYTLSLPPKNIRKP